MSRAEARLIHLAQLLVGGTGLVYAVMLYLLEAPDEFTLLHHPWQDETQALHVLTAPLLVFAIGLVWKRHAWQRVRSGYRARRATGLTLVAAFAPMVASGYLIQTAVEPGWRTAWIVIHVAVSLLWLLSYVVHLLRPRPDAPAAG